MRPTAHLDLWVADEQEQLAEVERLLALGASRVEWNYHEGADFVVLAGPDGNLFYVINANASRRPAVETSYGRPYPIIG